MRKNNSLGRLKKPLALLVSTTIFPMAFAADQSIADYDNHTILVDDGSGQSGNIELGKQATLLMTLDQGSSWSGNIFGNATDRSELSYSEVVLYNNSTFTGNIAGNNYATVYMDSSRFRGDIASSDTVLLNLMNSNYRGNVSSSGTDDNMSYITGMLSNNSLWDGAIAAENTSLYFYLDENSRRVGKASGENTQYNIYLYNGSQWEGDIESTLSIDMSSYHNISLDSGAKWTGNVTTIVNPATVNYASSYQSINVNQNSSFNGNVTLHAQADSALQPSFSVIHVSNDSVWNGDAIFSGVVNGNIQLINSSWNGTLTHGGWSSFDPENGPPVYMVISMSEWTGHINSEMALVNLDLVRGQWNITGSTKLNRLYSNSDGETIDFTANANPHDYTTLTVKDFEGDAHLVMRAGYFGQNDYGNDKLVILGDKNISQLEASNHRLTIVNNGTNNTYGTEVLTMVTTVDGLDSFTLTSGEVELGGYVYTLEKSGTNWILRPGEKGTHWEPAPEPEPGIDPEDPNVVPPGNPGGSNNSGGKPSISNPGKSAVNKVNVGYLLGYAETQTLYQRMGELRQSQSNGDVWARGYFGGFNQLSGGLLNGFKMNYNGVQVGTDAKIDVGNDALFLGMMFGLTHAKQDYATGKGTTKGKHIGFYSSYLTENDVYIDGVLKYSYFKDEMNVRDSQEQRVTGDSNSHSVSASLEAGKRFYFSEEKAGVYVEPQMQFTYARYSKAHMDLSNGLRVNIDGYDSMLGRAGVQLGYNVVESATPVNFYFKSSYVKEFDGKTDYTLNESKQKHSFKGDWWTNGVGVSVQAMNNHQLYLDMEHSDGNRFNQHQINAGYRFSF